MSFKRLFFMIKCMQRDKEIIQCPPKVLGQFLKLTNHDFLGIQFIPCKTNSFQQKANKMILCIKQRFMGPALDSYCLIMSFEINIFLEIIRRYFLFCSKTFGGHCTCKYSSFCSE